MRYLLAILLGIGIVAVLPAQQPELSKLSNAELVERLASKNPEPPKRRFSGKEGRGNPPAGYSREKQDDVYAAINELLRRDEACLDELISAFEDQRYSTSEDYYGNGFFNNHVGQMTYWIFLTKLEPKMGISWNPDLPTYFRTVVDSDKKDLQRWLDERKGKSLAELQTETCQWFLKQRHPNDVGDESWQRVRDGVQTRLDALKKTGRPMKSNRISLGIVGRRVPASCRDAALAATSRRSEMSTDYSNSLIVTGSLTKCVGRPCGV